ncbi:hypothetical protein SprV_0301348300 [Sparganum proliferum]
MDDEQLPRLFYGDVATGSRRQGGQNRRYKDTLKTSLRRQQINPVNKEDLARDRPTGRRTVKTGGAICEANRIASAKAKRGARKSQLCPPGNEKRLTAPTAPVGHFWTNYSTRTAPTVVSPSTSTSPPTSSNNVDHPPQPPLPSSSSTTTVSTPDKVQRHNKSPPGTFPSPDARFSHVHLDVVGPLPPSNGSTHLLTCVNRYTCWAEAIPLPNVQAETIVKAFVSRWVAMFGAPSTVTTDRGAQPPYDGPFRVLSRGPKAFRIQRDNREKVVSVDHLKAAVPDTPPDEPCGPLPSASPHATSISPSRISPLPSCPLPPTATTNSNTSATRCIHSSTDPVYITRSGRHVHFPDRLVTHFF